MLSTEAGAEATFLNGHVLVFNGEGQSHRPLQCCSVVSARGLCRNTKGTSLVKCLYARSLGMKTTPCVDWDLTEPCCRMQMHLSVLIVSLVLGLNLDQSLSHLSHASHLWVLPS